MVYSVLPLLVFLATSEGVFRIVEVWIPPRRIDLGLGFDPETRLFVPSQSDPETLVTNPLRCASFNVEAFRKTKDANTLRIFFLGGSSVNYLGPDILGLEPRLAQELRGRYDHVEIINAGGLSYGSQRIVLIAAEILEYDPDLVLIYMGHNEFEEVEQLDLGKVELLPFQRLLYKSALCRFAISRLADYQIRSIRHERNRRILASPDVDVTKVWQHAFSNQEIAERMDTFRDNYSLIVKMCAERGIAVVVGTLPSNLMAPLLDAKGSERYRPVKELFARGEFEKGAALGREILPQVVRHQASDAENAIVRSVASQYGVPLVDIEASVAAAEPHGVPGETLFADECHLNEQGSQILVEEFEREILRLVG
ncbi:MAG TPA: SGNH/GDSL hydrolase family protein [Candidatus Hydrogenedentes bacterium]|nr:SGNH/GDSL hydrolase family protein [Candidatus Hydrogenedentota bacterium]HPG66099.1 SGNH/GDSL hydrolase family protein [Candidatus Hydrogenedentota bacterium]